MQTTEAALTLSGITVHEPVLIFVLVTSSTGQKGCFRKATESYHRALFFLCLVSLNLFTYLGGSKCVCTSVCLPMPAETRREYWILWSWRPESCEQISVGVGGLILGLLEEQQVPLMTDSLLQSSLCSCKSAKYTRGTSSSDMLDFHPFLIGPDNHTHFFPSSCLVLLPSK